MTFGLVAIGRNSTILQYEELAREAYLGPKFPCIFPVNSRLHRSESLINNIFFRSLLFIGLRLLESIQLSFLTLPLKKVVTRYDY